MNVKEKYLNYRNGNNLKVGKFNDRVKLQHFLRDNLDAIWNENPKFTYGGLIRNNMTEYAIAFAYYDCRPTQFCRTRCYGLRISGIHDYYMLRLGVLTSESLKTGDSRYLNPVMDKIRSLNYIKIGHWGDATLEQIPVLESIISNNPNTTFWWYTRKIEIALAANALGLSNLRCYLSLDPTSKYPAREEYSYGITYTLGDGLLHEEHDQIINDNRLITIFPKKKGKSIENPIVYGIENHSKICKEKKMESSRKKDFWICHSCCGRCNFLPEL